MATLAEQIAAKRNAAGITAQPTAAGAGAALGGGGKLASVREALQTASVGNRKNDMPIGTGIFLLKSGKYVVTDSDKYKLSSFSFLCLKGVVDAAGIAHGTPGYTGPIPFETYETAVFQDFSPKYVKGTMSKNLSALKACMGWTAEKIKEYQKTDEGADILMGLLKGLMCVDMDKNTPTGEPCIFSNQVVIQMVTKPSIVEQKDPTTGKPLYTDDKGTKSVKTYINNFWDKKISLMELTDIITDDEIVKAFGTSEAFVTAVELETQTAAAG